VLALFGKQSENRFMFNLWHDLLEPFFGSNLFLAVATYVAGYIGFRIYKSQKQDEKRNAANIIVLEIERAEKGLTNLTVSDPIPSMDSGNIIVLMPTVSWDNYKHLFIADFVNRRAEWEKITDFYTLCAQYDESVVQNAKVLSRNTIERAVNYQRILANLAGKHAIDRMEITDTDELIKDQQKYLLKRQKISEEVIGSNDYGADLRQYTPKLYNQRASEILGIIDRNISVSTAGQEIKKIAEVRKGFFIKLADLFKKS